MSLHEPEERTNVQNRGQPSSPSPITSLDQLNKYVDIQSAAVDKLPRNTFTTEFIGHDRWEEFRKYLWGKGLESLEKQETTTHSDDDPYFVMEVPRSLPPIFLLDSASILVRSEYKEAEQAALSSLESGQSLFLVSGTPGIGKSVFLLQLLIRRLALGLPTVLQIKTSHPILFHANGVYMLTQVGDSLNYLALDFSRDRPTHRIWALFDTTLAVPQPATCIMPPSSFFLVSVTSPRSGPHQEWHKKLYRTHFFMSPWSFLEVIQARHLFKIQPTESELWYLFEKYGASPRELAQYSKSPKLYENLLNSEINKIKPGDLRGIFENPTSNPTSHFIITLYPSDDHSDCIAVPASPHVFSLLAEKHLKSRIEDMAYLYDLFERTSVTSPTAGLIFELRMHKVLLERKTIQLFPIICERSGPKNLIYDTYESSGTEYTLPELQLLRLEKGIRPDENSYCVPGRSKFPTVDSLLFFNPLDNSPPILLMIQMTRGQAHDTKVEGLRNVDELGFPSEVRRYHVVVTPKGISPKITVPLEYFGTKVEEVKRAPNEAFPVFHCPVSREELLPVDRVNSCILSRRK